MLFLCLLFLDYFSFLAIIFNERRLTNVKYMNQNITQAFLKAIDELNNCLLLCKHPKTEEGFIKTSKIIHNLQQRVATLLPF